MRATVMDPAVERACLDLYDLAEALARICGGRRRLGCALYEAAEALVGRLAEALRRSGGSLEGVREAFRAEVQLTAGALGLGPRHEPALALLRRRLGERADAVEAAALSALLAYRALAAGPPADPRGLAVALCAAAARRLVACAKCREVILKTRRDYRNLEEWAKDVGVSAETLRPAWRLAKRLYNTSGVGLRTALLQLLIEGRISL
ncbi:MAG: hypothetical protein RRB51_11895 [Thermoproteus sp.]|nr:hypothetical protein [Thermoproteus sp.]